MPRILHFLLLAKEFHQRGDGDRAAQLYQRILALDELTEHRTILTRVQLVDALRLASLYDQAMAELGSARQEATRIGERSLVERLDLLTAEIARDRGDCLQARSAFEEFLERHPESDWRRYARRTLASLKREGDQCT